MKRRKLKVRWRKMKAWAVFVRGHPVQVFCNRKPPKEHSNLVDFRSVELRWQVKRGK